MRQDGVTLVELLVIVSIIGILAVALGFSYQGWMGNYRIESQTKEIYADLMDARTRAMTQNRMHFVVMETQKYQMFEDTNGNNEADPGAGDNPAQGYANPKTVQYDLGWTGNVIFNTRGLSSSTATITVPLTISKDANPDYDCVLVYESRIQMGKMSGANCVYK